MRSRKRVIFAALAVLIAGGAIRMPLEQAITADFREHGLIGKPLEVGVREKIGQNSWVVALAGLRTLVASFSGLRAADQFANTDWPGLEESMKTTVQLAPNTDYYWDMGGWHLGYNAASYYRNQEERSKLRAEAESRRWVYKGRDFYERGVHNNPGSWDLPMKLGNLYSSSYRFPDDKKAVEAYARAYAVPGAPAQARRFLLQARARTGEDPAVLLEELHRIFKEDTKSRVTTLLCLDYVLRAQLSLPADPVAVAVEIFGSEKKALVGLGTYFTNIHDRMPQTDVARVLSLLEQNAGISPDDEKSYLHQRRELLLRDRDRDW